MRKKVWIINHYASEAFSNRGGRHYWIAKFLKQKGYDPLVICSNSKHNSNCEVYFKNDNLFETHLAEEICVPFVFIRTRPYSKNGIERVFNMMDFYRNLLRTRKDLIDEYGKPDIIYCSSVHPLALVAGIKIAKKEKIKCICEIRDLWPESIIAYSNLKRTNPIIIGLRLLEKRIYTNADELIFTMGGGKKYIIDQGWDNSNGGPINLNKVHYINNGVDLKRFEYNKEHYNLTDQDLDDNKVFKIVYAGSIRKGNNIDFWLDVSKLISNPRVKFLFWGDGDQLIHLKQRLIDEKIENVIFKGFVDKQYIPGIISKASINILDGKSDPLYRYGISLNKLFEYLAAGKPVLMAYEAMYNPITDYDAGSMVINPTAESVADEIEKFISMNRNDYLSKCLNAKKAAAEFDFEKLTNELISVIENNEAKK